MSSWTAPTLLGSRLSLGSGTWRRLLGFDGIELISVRQCGRPAGRRLALRVVRPLGCPNFGPNNLGPEQPRACATSMLPLDRSSLPQVDLAVFGENRGNPTAVGRRRVPAQADGPPRRTLAEGRAVGCNRSECSHYTDGGVPAAGTESYSPRLRIMPQWPRTRGDRIGPGPFLIFSP